MNLKNVFLKNIEAEKTLAPISCRKPAIDKKSVLSDMKSEAFIKGKIFIPQSFLQEQLTEYHNKSEKKFKLESLSCNENCLNISISAEKMFSMVTVSMELVIEEAIIKIDKQLVKIRVNDEKLLGSNLMGKFAAVIIKTFFKDLLKEAVSNEAISKNTIFSEKDRTIAIDLARLDAVNKLLNPVAGTETCILDFVSFELLHAKNGLEVKLNGL